MKAKTIGASEILPSEETERQTERPLSPAIVSSRRLVRIPTKQQEEQPHESRVSQKDLRFFPNGEVPSNVDRDWTMLIVGFIREVYGVNFVFAKFDACELKILTFVVLNYWHANAGLLEQYSLIAAIIFTLYYIFQGYF